MQARLGITRWLIEHGVARLEEIRASDGTLENLYIRVCSFETVRIPIYNLLRDPSSTGARS